MTRLRVTSADEVVLDAVAGHLGRLRRADLAAVSHPEPHALKLDAAERQVRRDGPNARKRDLTALSSARWANAIISANDAQYRSVREAQDRHIADLRAAIEAIAKRLSQPTVDMLTRQERTARKKARLPKGYPTQAERFQKQRRLQALRAELHRVTADRDARRVRVTEGSRRLVRTRHNLDAGGLTLSGWREAWQATRWRIGAIGSGGRAVLQPHHHHHPRGDQHPAPRAPWSTSPTPSAAGTSCPDTAKFSYRRDEWLARITGRRPVSYTIARKPGRAGVYLSADLVAHLRSPGTDHEAVNSEARAVGPVVGVDLNHGHLAVRQLEPYGNPVGGAEGNEFSLTGSTAHRDAQVRHAITRLIRYTRRHGIELHRGRGP